MSELSTFEKCILWRFLQKGDHTTHRLINGMFGDTNLIKSSLKKLYDQGFLTMIKVGRKFPYRLTKKGKECIKQHLVFRDGDYFLR